MRYLIGFGNYSAYDDSVGLRVIERVASEGREEGFRAVDLSANSLDLLSYCDRETEGILIVDSARMGKAPGDYAFFNPEDVETRKTLEGISTHEGDLLKVLALARELGSFIPPLAFMGIEPETIKNEFGLSPALEARLEEYVRAAISRCRAPIWSAGSRTASPPNPPA